MLTACRLISNVQVVMRTEARSVVVHQTPHPRPQQSLAWMLLIMNSKKACTMRHAVSLKGSGAAAAVA